jgi:ribosome-associated protein
MATPETRRQLLVAVSACEDKKGEDTRILELDPADSGLADFFLITSASNDRQVVAIADEIEFRLKKEFGLYAHSVEGRRQSEWILLDYVDIVIHVFLAEKRAFYDIERLRKSARNLSGADVEAELKAALAKKTLQARKKAAAPPTTSKSVSPAKKQVPRTSIAKGESTVSPVKKAAPKKAAVKKAAPKKAAKAPVKKAAAKPAAPALKKAAKKAAAPAKAAKPVKKAASKAAVPTAGSKPILRRSPNVPAPPSPPPPPPMPVTPISQGARGPILQEALPADGVALAASAAPKAKSKIVNKLR